MEHQPTGTTNVPTTSVILDRINASASIGRPYGRGVYQQQLRQSSKAIEKIHSAVCDAQATRRGGLPASNLVDEDENRFNFSVIPTTSVILDRINASASIGTSYGRQMYEQQLELEKIHGAAYDEQVTELGGVASSLIDEEESRFVLSVMARALGDRAAVKPPSLRESLSLFIRAYSEQVKTIDTSKLSIFPLEYPMLYEFFEKQRDMFWVSAEIDFSTDRGSWDSLQENEREFLLFILFFFSQADGIVMDNLSSNFQEEVPFKEAKAFYAMQGAIEAIHAETYALMIETVIRDEETKLKATNAIQHCPEITTMAAWVTFWMGREHPLEIRVLAFAIYEGVFFNVGFVPIRWLGGGDKNKVPGFIQSNELISRDEALHMNFAVMLLWVFGFPGKEEHKETVEVLVESSFEIVSALIHTALDNRGLLGMGAEEMIEYTKVVYNSLISALEFDEPFPGAMNPFPFMQEIGMANKSNFFEQKVTEYRKVCDTEYRFEVKPDGTW